MKTAAQILFILCLPVLLLTASVSGAMNCRWLYQYGFNKYDIGRVTGLTPQELKKAADGLIHYFNSGEENINVIITKDGQPFVLFNEREAAHLKDVKGLFRLVYKVLLGALIYFLLYISLTWARRQDRRRLAKGLLFGGGLTLLLMLALGIMIASDFDQFFLEFHLLSFANDFWQLNPATDYLIMLFPQGFWFDATLVCALGTAAGAIILGGLGWWRIKKDRPLQSA